MPAEIFLSLGLPGPHNVDLVNPTHFSQCSSGCCAALPVHVVWNSGGMSGGTLRTLEVGWMFSSRPEVVGREGGGKDKRGQPTKPRRQPKPSGNVRQTGPYILEDGLLRRGV